MRRSRLAALTIAFALVFGACSSEKKSSSDATATTAAGAATSAPRGAGDPVCDSLRSYNERFGRVNLGLSNPEQLRAAMQDAGRAIADAQGRAPDAIKADLAVLTRAFQQLLASLEQADYDLSKLSLAQVQQLQTPEVTAASENVNTYLRDRC
jgi:hypothetical protein